MTDGAWALSGMDAGGAVGRRESPKYDMLGEVIFFPRMLNGSGLRGVSSSPGAIFTLLMFKRGTDTPKDAELEPDSAAPGLRADSCRRDCNALRWAACARRSSSAHSSTGPGRGEEGNGAAILPCCAACREQ